MPSESTIQMRYHAPEKGHDTTKIDCYIDVKRLFVSHLEIIGGFVANSKRVTCRYVDFVISVPLRIEYNNTKKE